MSIEKLTNQPVYARAKQMGKKKQMINIPSKAMIGLA